MFMYIDRMNGGTGHLTIIVGTDGRKFATKNWPQDRVFDQFFC